MATLPLQERVVQRPNRMHDRVFFSAMLLFLCATVLFGFSKTYFMAGMVRAPLPNALIHIHGAAFTLWMVLLLVQTALISTRNIRVHRTLGMGGFCLAVAMVVLGSLAAVDALRRGSAPLGLDAQTFFVVPISDVLLFSLFIAFAYRNRSKPEAHKRLILIGTLSLMDAAIARWPIAVIHNTPPLQDVVLLGYLLIVIGFDLFSLKRVSKTTVWASGVLILVHLTRVPVGRTAAWHAVASFALGKH